MPDFPSPLPLAAFEEYMLRDDRPAFPMSIIARLRFAGQLDRCATAEALETVVARHPLLRAKVHKTSAGRLEWIAATDRTTAVTWGDDAGFDRLPSMQPIDLASHAGFRVWAASDLQQSSLVFQVHHAACDGKALFQVLDDFLRSYARVFAGNQSENELSPCHPQTLPGRGSFGLTVRKYLGMLPAQLTGLLGVRKFLMRKPVPLLERVAATSGELPAGFPHVSTGHLEGEEVRKLSAAAADSKVTMNDLLLRDFFLAIDDFRSRHQATTSRDWIRFSVPMNLRQAADRHMPAANMVSMIFLDRNRVQIADAESLLRSIHAEMDLIRRRQLGLIFVLSLSVLRRLPGGLEGRVNQGRCEATCVLSNLGRALADSPLPRRNEKIVAGNVLLDGIDFFAPVREGTAVAVALVYYAGGLQVCLQYDSRRITKAQAGDLMATYLQKIRDSLEKSTRTVQARAA